MSGSKQLFLKCAYKSNYAGTIGILCFRSFQVFTNITFLAIIIKFITDILPDFNIFFELKYYSVLSYVRANIIYVQLTNQFRSKIWTNFLSIVFPIRKVLSRNFAIDFWAYKSHTANLNTIDSMTWIMHNFNCGAKFSHWHNAKNIWLIWIQLIWRKRLHWTELKHFIQRIKS